MTTKFATYYYGYHIRKLDAYFMVLQNDWLHSILYVNYNCIWLLKTLIWFR